MSLTPVTPGREPTATMASVGTATSPPLRAIAGAALALAAVVESLVRLAGLDATIAYVLVLCLLGVATTTPVIVRDAMPAAVSVTGAAVLSLAVFDTLTVAGAAAQVFVAFRLGRSGSGVALLLGAPYVVAALANRTGTYLAIMAIMLAALVPIAAGAGTARRVRLEERDNRAANHAGRARTNHSRVA